jgi:hypothetical protein
MNVRGTKKGELGVEQWARGVGCRGSGGRFAIVDI